jgi:hypothetical protein
MNRIWIEIKNYDNDETKNYVIWCTENELEDIVKEQCEIIGWNNYGYWSINMKGGEKNENHL